MKVIKMTPSKHVPDRWYAELENGTTLRVNVALIADYSLFTGRELTEEETESLLAAAGKINAKARALRILGSRQLSHQELYRRLVEKGETNENAEEAVAWLESIGAINDTEYATIIVRHYTAKGYGIGRVKNELYQRGIPRELWDDAIADMPDSQEPLDRLVATKLKGRLPEMAEMKKVTDALCRRGYTWEEIKSALRRYEQSLEEE